MCILKSQLKHIINISWICLICNKYFCIFYTLLLPYSITFYNFDIVTFFFTNIMTANMSLWMRIMLFPDFLYRYFKQENIFINTAFNCPSLILYPCIYPLLIIHDFKLNLIFFIFLLSYHTYPWVLKWMKKRTNESPPEGRWAQEQTLWNLC